MKLYSLTLVALCAMTGMLLAQAAAPVDVEALAKESEAFSVETAKTPATPAQVKAKVKEAIALLKAEGTAAFAKFRGKTSPFIFGGTYCVIRDGEGNQVLHPIKPKMEGKNVLANTDSKGKPFYAEEHNIVTSKGHGWFSYWWPKPGEKTPSQKLSYTEGIDVGGKLYIVTCGVYDLSEAQIAELEKEN